MCVNNGGAGFQIPDFNGTNASLTVPIPFDFGDASVLHDVNVETDITHTYPGDLTARITSPAATQITLFERPGTTTPEFMSGGGFGCGLQNSPDREDINALFDDQSPNPPIENEPCISTPAFSGDYKPHDPSPNDLSAYDDENPNGDWLLRISDSAGQDFGTLNEACITVEYAGVTFDKWVSINPICSDKVDAISVLPGTNVYFCYTVSNPSTEAFTINSGDATDDQGHDLSGLETTYAEGASQTVIVPLLAGTDLPIGITVNNADITATFATSNLDTSEMATVTVGATPTSGIKQLYFDNANSNPAVLTRVAPVASVNTRTNPDLTPGASHISNQVPFSQAFTINGGSDITVQLWLRRLPNNSGSRTAKVEIFNGGTGASLGSTTQTWAVNGMQLITFTIPIAVAQNFAVGDFVQAVLTNEPVSAGNIRMRTIRSGINSQVQMDTNTVINVESVSVFAAAFPSTTQFPSYTPGSTVFIRATVSDPFGNADITSSDISITDSALVAQVTSAAMTSVATPSGATKVFEFQYTIPATPQGIWSLDIAANEGFEGTVSHNVQSPMIVGTTSIEIGKTSSVTSDPVNATNPKAIPNAIVEYTISVNNSGFGYADNNTLVINDPLPANTTFFFGLPLNPATFIDGIIPSSLTFNFISLASTTDDIDFSSDGGGSFITPALPDVNGFDTTVPPINFIRINPKGTFKGSDDGVSAPSFEIKIRVKVE